MQAQNVPQASATQTPEHMSALAVHVLASLQARTGFRSRARLGPVRVCPRILAELIALVSAPDYDSQHAITTFCALDLPAEALSDVYIPAAARRLGLDWMENRATFAQVTVATGRLQELLGRLVQSNDIVASSHRATPNVLVLSFSGDEHTLGWKLVTLQLRRLGAAAHAVLDVQPAYAAEMMEQVSYDLVLVSSSRIAVLGQIEAMISALHGRMTDVPPIVLGGIVVDLLDDAELPPDIQRVTNCLQEALSHKKTRTAPCYLTKK